MNSRSESRLRYFAVSRLTPPSPFSVPGWSPWAAIAAQALPLGPPDDGGGDVQVCGARAAAGQDERPERLDPLEVAVAVGLEVVDPGGSATRSGGYS